MRIRINRLIAGDTKIVEQPEVIEISDSEIVRIGRHYFQMACNQDMPKPPEPPELHVIAPQAPDLQVFAHWEQDDSGLVTCSNCKGLRRDNRVGYTHFCNKCGANMSGGDGYGD